ncbi:hypothetical protein [Staphylococcus aureus]
MPTTFGGEPKFNNYYVSQFLFLE